MSDNRLNGLALLYVQRDIPLNYDAIISMCIFTWPSSEMSDEFPFLMFHL